MRSEKKLVFKPIKEFNRRRKRGTVILRSKWYASDTEIKCGLVKYCHAATHYAEKRDLTREL